VRGKKWETGAHAVNFSKLSRWMSETTGKLYHKIKKANKGGGERLEANFAPIS